MTPAEDVASHCDLVISNEPSISVTLIDVNITSTLFLSQFVMS
jgi:hypothetical protein